MRSIMEKATFSEIYKLVEGRGGKIEKCFDGLFDVALLFFPAFMCKETAGITGFQGKLGTGKTLIGIKETIARGVAGALDGFVEKETNYVARYENMQIAHMLIVYAAFFDAAKEMLPDEKGIVGLSAYEKFSISKQEEIGEDISSILRNPWTNEKPVVILGQPGAGKTLLCYMLATQILCHECHVILVRLRDTVADKTTIEQIEDQIARDTVYEFLHNTFGEFLAADFIVKAMGKVVKGLCA